MAAYYRKTSRELKRIDSLQRSFVYSSFGEQLIGMASIRAYQQQAAFRAKLQHSVDMECRAYYMSIICQRWLAIRVDFLGNVLIAGIAIFGVVFRNSASPTKLGVVLVYAMSATSSLGSVGRQADQ